MFFDLLRLHQLPEIQLKVLNILSISTRNKECIQDIARYCQLPCLLVLLIKLPKATEIILRTLMALVSNTTIVKEMLEYGSLIYILNVFISQNGSIRGNYYY